MRLILGLDGEFEVRRSVQADLPRPRDGGGIRPLSFDNLDIACQPSLFRSSALKESWPAGVSPGPVFVLS